MYPPHIGGVEEVVRLLAEGFVSREHIESGVLVCNEGPHTVRETVNGVEIIRVGSLARVWSEPIAPAFLAHLRRSDADIYHFHTPFPLGELGGLLMDKDRRMVTWYHSDVLRQKLLLRAYRPMLERFLRRCEVIMVSSPHLVRSSPFLQPLAGHCRVVHFGIDTRKFQVDESISRAAAAIRERYCSGRGLVLFVGRLVYYKGVEYLVEAMGGVDADLLILGSGPLKKSLEQQAVTAGIPERVHFVDRVRDEELSAYFHACDMLVLPSTARTEAFGLVLLEAQACGKPVISTELGTGTSYANLDEVTGMVVPPAESRSLTEAMNRLLDNPSLRQEMGLRGKERVEQEFELSGMIDRVAEIYAEVAREDRR